MGLAGQGSRASGERGYAMAALLVTLAVMAVLMSVAMPVWRQEARREKEAELVFRGEQYARAVALYRRKNQQAGNVYPPSIEALIEGRYLRKKYKDPMTKDGEFALVPAMGAVAPGQSGSADGSSTPGSNFGQSRPGQAPPGQAPSGRTQDGRGTQKPPSTGGRSNSPSSQFSLGPSAFNQSQGGQVAIGGIAGVVSKSKENSLRAYRGQTRYDQWLFVFSNLAIAGGGVGPNSPDGRGGTPGMNQQPGFNNRGNRGDGGQDRGFDQGGRGGGRPGSGGRGFNSNPGGVFNNPGRGQSDQPSGGGRPSGPPRGRGPGE